MKRLLIAAILFSLFAGVLAANDAFVVPAQRELDDLMASVMLTPLDTVTVGDFVRVRSLASVAQQQRDYVRRATILSHIAPGLGHYSIGERGQAFAFFGAELALRIATTTAAYFLLPPAVRISNLNYLQTPIADIETQWKALAPADYLAPAGIMLTGSILSAVIRSFAATNARTAAQEKLAGGEVEFEPFRGQ